jgi:N-acetylglucosaminyldiphosphoundecaprenol N-acetyl-beta-D-mannosaminyltransferase
MTTSSFEALSTPPATLPPIASASVLDVPLALTDYDAVVDWIDAAVTTDARAYVCVAAVHTVMEAREDEGLRAAVDQASFTVPDGQPLVWALRALGHDISARVYGPELMARTLERAASGGEQTHYFYGGRDDGSLLRLTQALRERFLGLRVAGGWSPPHRALSESELDAVAARINRAAPDVVWVGIGVPKQEKWMAAMRARLDAPVLIGVGAAFDFHAGLVPQAPAWMQRSGLEWAYRLRQEPRRLWRRYARHNPRFVTGFARQWAGSRRGRGAR